MTLTAFLLIKGSKQGDIKGSVTQKGREGWIAVIAVSHEILSPHEMTSGKATGKRQHKPIVITKELDRSTIALRQALATDEIFPQLELQFFRPARTSAAGISSDECYFMIKLTDAAISSASFVMPNDKVHETMYLGEYEEVAFSYRTIQWTWMDGNVTAQDNS